MITVAHDGLRHKQARLDTLAGVGVAQAIADGPDYSRSIPEGEPERDSRGLRMEIWF